MDGSVNPAGPSLPVQRITEAPSAQDALTAILAEARREVLVLADPYASDPIADLRAIEATPLRRGVRCRVIVPDRTRLRPEVSERLIELGTTRAAVRTAPEVPTNALVVDAVVALLPAEQSPTGLAAFRVGGLVTTITDLFERIWPTAAPLAAAQPPPELTTRERELLTLLSAGNTDESAAAQLGVSVRTVRRMVADIMDRLGARSRFQAGLKAADRGWLLNRTG